MVEKSQLPKYPLKEVLDIKKRRVEEAERVVKEKKAALDAEKEKLKKREEERDKVLKHYQDKLLQFRQELDQGTTSRKLEQLKVYIQLVQEKLKVEEKKVVDQKKQVDVAEKNLEAAKNQLKARQKEQDKIEMHKKEWEKETLKDMEIEEVRAEDEIGSTMFLSRFVQRKSQKK